MFFHNKKILVLLVSGVAAVSVIGGYYFFSFNNESPHGDGTRQLSCSNEVITSLRLKRNGKVLWKMKHGELFNMEGVVPSLDRRFKGKNIVPVALLLQGQENIRVLEFIPCEGDSKSMTVDEMVKIPNVFYLGQNRKGRLKLLRYEGNQHYSTLTKNIVHVNLHSK